MTKTLGLIAAAVALAACVSTSKVVPMGKDSYMITALGQGAPAAGTQSVAAVEQANKYCAAMHKVIVVRRMDTQNATIGSQSTNLVFSCVDENDPEYQRPNLRKDPTTVIEDQRQNPR
jgi:hypothetical protein